MNTNNSKSVYVRPEITKVEIDNEISVILMSTPVSGAAFIPVGQGDGGVNNGDVNGSF